MLSWIVSNVCYACPPGTLLVTVTIIASMFKNEQECDGQCDEYIREYAFEPELLINRDDYLRQEAEHRHAAGLLTSTEASRLDDTYSRRSSHDLYNELKSQVDVEIEAFYYVSGCGCVWVRQCVKMCDLIL